MDFKDSQYTKEILDFHMPRFNELPNIALYMDQVLNIIENSLNIFCSDEDEKIITKSMINNYVKQGVVEKPTKKQYQRSQVAYFIMISVLKKVLSISDISKVINCKEHKSSELYDMFCDELEGCLKSTFLDEGYGPDDRTSISEKAMIAAVRAFCNRIYFERLMMFEDLD